MARLSDWVGKPITSTTTKFWNEWFGTSTSGKAVTIHSAMQLSTVWACVRLLSETVSTLPLKLYQRMPDGSRVPARKHPLYRLLCVSPNAEMTPARFMLMVVASLCLWGNAFIEKLYVGSKLVSLDPLLPQHMTVKRLDTGRLEYTYRDPDKGTERVIDEKALMHVRGFGLDGVCGMLPVRTGQNVFGAAMSADEAAAGIFAKGMQASGFLSSDSTLNQAQRDQLRESMGKFVGSNGAGKLMVLEAGLKYQGITMNPEAAQMLETRSFNVEEMCRWFRVPPFKVGHMDKASSWASSSESQNLMFLTDCLRPVLVNIEQEITRCLLEPGEAAEYYPEFGVEGLLRADSAGRSAYYHSSLNDGWMNRNEVRSLENLAPIPGGEKFTVAVNLVPLDKLGEEVPAASQAQASMAAWLGLDKVQAAVADLSAKFGNFIKHAGPEAP